MFRNTMPGLELDKSAGVCEWKVTECVRSKFYDKLDVRPEMGFIQLSWKKSHLIKIMECF